MVIHILFHEPRGRIAQDLSYDQIYPYCKVTNNGDIFHEIWLKEICKPPEYVIRNHCGNIHAVKQQRDDYHNHLTSKIITNENDKFYIKKSFDPWLTGFNLLHVAPSTLLEAYWIFFPSFIRFV